MIPWEDATDLASDLTTGTVTAVQALSAYVAQIDRQNGTLNAYVTLNPDALAQAQASDKRRDRGQTLGPLDGVPFAIKDNLVVQGMPAAWGSRVFAGPVAKADEAPIARLRAAGAVILGKTNVPEFCLEGYCGNALFGTTGNPWAPTLTPGGSSGGSVAAVASGMAAVALGTDGGGSIRRPSGYTGLVGLKPSIGAIARAGGLPQLLMDMEVVGPITRSVRDAALIFGVLSEWPEPAPLPHRPLRILYVETFPNAPLDPLIRNVLRAQIEAFRTAGHQVTSGALPFDVSPVMEVWGEIGKLGLAELAAMQPQFAQASATYQAMAQEGATLPPGRAESIQALLADLRAQAAAAFVDTDLIMTPSSAAMPWPAADPYPPVIDGVPVGPRGHAVYTGWVNAAGLPAINLPAPAPDLPIGYQMIGPPGSDWLLLSMAARLCSGPNPWPKALFIPD